MADVRAADLPEGSIVASRYAVMIACQPPEVTERWSSGSMLLPDDAADELLALPGGTVLRHGYGD